MALALITVTQSQGMASRQVDTDLPALGRSRFDQLIGAGPVPFPFRRLLQRIDAQLVAEPGLAPAKSVLIPLGRSLQRAAGAPDFFRYPRVVIAIDGNTRPGVPPLKDRLFIGYHEKGAVLEVISYNEAAGRFEFQLVRDYRPGGKPELVYARRTLCLACHQNAAPLFARPLWDETPANPAIAERLKAEGRSFYGVPLAGTDIAYFIDNATDRANLLPIWQRLWWEGCGDGQAGVACRRELFAAALALGLSATLPDGPRLAGIARQLDRRWPTLWPGGLAIPNPDIPNRDPLAFVPEPEPGPTAHPATLPEELAELSRRVHIPARFEPLNPRPPLEVWTAPDKARLLDGLAGMLAAADLDALDRTLAARPAKAQRLALNCETRDKGAGRTRFVCAATGVRLEGAFSRGRDGRASGRIDGLTLPGAPADIQLTGRVQGRGAALRASLELRRGPRHARLADGRRLAGLEVTANSGSLAVTDDFAPVTTALAGLESIGAARVFPSWDGMAQLILALGDRPRREPTVALPAPRAEVPPTTRAAGPAATFLRYCGQCHDTADTAPPNFLRGDPDGVAARLAQCAPRIYYRLRMWDTPEAQRGKTPMPPLPALAAHSLDVPEWTRSEPRAQLLEHVRGLLPGRGSNPDTVLRRPFESLPPCLPSPRLADAMARTP